MGILVGELEWTVLREFYRCGTLLVSGWDDQTRTVTNNRGGLLKRRPLSSLLFRAG